MIRILRVFFALVLLLTATHLTLSQDSKTTDANRTSVISDPLVRVLIVKGLLTETEGRAITEIGDVAAQRDRLASLLREKGIISSAEYEAVRAVVPLTETVGLSAKSTVEVADKAE